MRLDGRRVHGSPARPESAATRLLPHPTAVATVGAACSRGRTRRPGLPRRRDLSQLSHKLVGRHRTRALMLDNRWTMTCGYGFRRTGRTLSIGLRIKCLPPGRRSLQHPGRLPRNSPGLRLAGTSDLDIPQFRPILTPWPACAENVRRRRGRGSQDAHSGASARV
jgi:hypothetical protein